MPDAKCFLCGGYNALERHHIFGASNRKKSERYGLVVYLCGEECHRNGKKAVHQCRATMDALHEYGQRKFMCDTGKSKSDFIAEFGKNYIDDE